MVACTKEVLCMQSRMNHMRTINTMSYEKQFKLQQKNKENCNSRRNDRCYFVLAITLKQRLKDVMCPLG